MRTTAIATAACLTLISLATADPAKAAIRKPTHIEPQSLSAALKELAQGRELQVLYFAEMVRDRQTPGASGEITLDEAFSQLLAGTGLTYRFVDDQTVTIVPVSLPSTGLRFQNGDPEASVLVNAAEDESESSRIHSFQRLLAQTAGESSSTQSAESHADLDSGKLEEIIVTARKVSERLQDVPVSVTVISGNQLEASGAVDIKDVLGKVPGLSMSAPERGLGRYAIRGIANGVRTSGTEATVGTYLDDVSLITSPSNAAGAFDVILFDIDRVEVLKGPQGTLYGGSAMGGAIKYVSARPDPSAFSSSVATGVGTTAHGSESYNAEGVVNIPLIADVLAVRAGFYYLHEGGYVDNVANADIVDATYSSTAFPIYTPLVRPSLSLASQDDYNDANTYVGRLSLLWQPDPSWSIRPAFLYQDTESDNPLNFFTNLDGLTSSNRSIDQPTTDRASISSLDVVKNWGAVELTSLTAYFDRDFTYDREYSFFVGSLVPTVPAFYSTDSFAHYQRQTKTLSQELRIASSPDATNRLRWTAGLYYSDQDEEIPQVVPILSGALLGYKQDISRSLEQHAVFGDASYRLTDSLELTAGLRWFEIETNVDSTVEGVFAGVPPGGIPIHGVSHFKEDGVNPKVGLSYKLNDNHLLYTSAAKGFRPGATSDGDSIATLCPEDIARLGLTSLPDHYDSDNLWSYELGSKNTLGDGRVVLNGALFYSDWKDVQQSVRLPTCGGNFTANAGAARVQGAELEMTFNVTAALLLGGNATFTDAEITDVGGFSNIFTKGEDLLDTPEWMASGYASYSIPVGASWRLQLQADYQYRSKQRQAFDETQGVRFPVNGVYGATNGTVPYAALYQESYDVVNAFVSLANGPTTLRLYVHNALDSQPLLDHSVSAGASGAATIRPRTIGLQLRHEF